MLVSLRHHREFCNEMFRSADLCNEFRLGGRAERSCHNFGDRTVIVGTLGAIQDTAGAVVTVVPTERRGCHL